MLYKHIWWYQVCNEDDVNDVLKLIRGNNLLEIAYEMLCWCVENGYVEHNS